ncbi:MAG TPA: SusD/RagB family nutrient-binding outer membrane lipoprotein [Chitinophagaceae bacterium]|nr:SusD/RagB family nutrient-binding outer membrane lipoprotein [Chitinophagaceae bacterium]
MKQPIKIFIAIITGTLVLTSCQKKFEEFESNPNRAEQVTPELVFRGIASDMNGDAPWSLVSRWNQFDCCNYNYYGDQRYDWTGASLNYSSLNNVIKMEEEAKRLGGNNVNPYTAIGKFFRAFFFYRMTNLVGDLPMTEALKGEENLKPVYNNQKEIFVQVLKWLEESNTELQQLIQSPDLGNTTDGQLLKGDIYYDNKLKSWQKAVNTFRLRVLIALSKKEADADLKLKQQFADIVSDKIKYPVMEGMQDNLQYIYNGINKYPSNPDNLGFDATRYNMSETYLNKLVDLKDPRAYITAEPATKQLTLFHKTPADITAYVGANSGEDLTNMSSKMSSVDTADYSVRSRTRYYSSYAAEPGVIIGYAEMCFNIAEAINRGWATGSAEEWYKKGIRASLGFYGVPVDAPGSITKTYKGVSYTINFDFENSYYQQAAVKYKGDNANGLEQILTQKYLAFFQNSGREAYYNWRRTNVPVFLTGTGTGNGGKIPKRYQYPSSERTTNGENWESTLQKQFGGTDDINAEMWLIK